VQDFIEAVRASDALLIGSPVFHGGPPGLLKNAIDHLQPLMTDQRVYLSGRAVCCIAAGGGLPGAISTLSALRDVIHSLRGWPTPMQVPVNSSLAPFDEAGACVDPKLEKTMRAAAADMLAFLGAMRRQEQPLEVAL
jgi:FMN reductase